MNPYQELANAVIENAVKDYKQSLKYHFKHPNRKEYCDSVSELELFFRSEWFCALTDLDGEYLLIRIRSMVLKEMSI